MTAVAKITGQLVHTGVSIVPFDPESNRTQKRCTVLPEGQNANGEQKLSSSENNSGCNSSMAIAAQHNGPQSCVMFFPTGEISTKTLPVPN